MKKLLRRNTNYFLIVALTLLLAACSSSNSWRKGYGSEKAPAVYRVKKGDTLFAIAWRFGLDQKTIQRQNKISNPNKIFVGQRLRLKSGYTKTQAISYRKKKSTTKKAVTRSKTIVRKGNWSWPVRGKVLRRFNPARVGANGIRIAGKPGQTVNAAEGGTVAYKGNGLSGYGNVVIIKHHNGLLSAYGFLSKTYVKEGQKIKKRQKIGTVGYASNKQHMLHFEVRRKGKPVNPLSYIGSTYHF